MAAQLHVLEPGTFRPFSVPCHLSEKQIEKCDAQVPDFARFLLGKTSRPSKFLPFGVTHDEDGSVTHESVLPEHFDDPSNGLHRAELLLRCLIVRMEGMVCDRETANALKNMLCRLWGAAMSLMEPKIYRGSGLVVVKQEVVCSSTYMNPSPAVLKDIASGKLPLISIPTLDRSWMVPVRDAVISTFVESLDLKQAWLAGVQQSIIVWHAVIDHTLSLDNCRRSDNSHPGGINHCGQSECLARNAAGSRARLNRLRFRED